MALSTSFAGDAKGAGDYNLDLFLRQFSGEVITAFETANIMMPLHIVRTISQGKSAQFPVLSDTSAEYHTPGTSLIEATPASGNEFQKFTHNERLIAIDNLLVSAAFIDSLDEARAHYEYRSEYSRKMGYALAKRADVHLMSTVLQGSKMTAIEPQGAGGGDIELSCTAATVDAAITSSVIVSALFEAAAAMDANDIPSEDRYAVLPPVLYYNLISNGTAGFAIANSVANSDIGGSGFGSGLVPQIAGFEIYKSNNIPTETLASDGGVRGPNNYDAPLTEELVKGLIFHRSAVGTVKLRDLSMEAEYQIERQGTLLVAKYAMGHGVLRPDCCYALTNSEGA